MPYVVSEKCQKMFYMNGHLGNEWGKDEKEALMRDDTFLNVARNVITFVLPIAALEKTEEKTLHHSTVCIIDLDQACQTGGPRAACGHFACFLRPE